jgi:hypothetical protein
MLELGGLSLPRPAPAGARGFSPDVVQTAEAVHAEATGRFLLIEALTKTVAGSLRYRPLQVYGRPKKVDSILDKWERKGHAYTINDAVGITMVFHQRDLTAATAQQVLAEFAVLGHEPVWPQWKNSHVRGDRDYKLKMRMRSRLDGYQWELQLRFAEAAAVSKGTHHDFEIARDANTGLHLAREAELRVIRAMSAVVCPAHVVAIGDRTVPVSVVTGEPLSS